MYQEQSVVWERFPSPIRPVILIKKSGFSISTSLIPIEWEKAKINILDTPGYFDFVGEVEEAVSAADAAVIVVSGKAGVQVGTEKAWELCDKYNLPRMVYVTEMDMDDASFRQVVEDLTVRYGKKIAPHFQPIRENEKLVGYINIIKNAGRRYTGIGQREECEIPDYCLPNLKILRDSLMEAVAETSEEFMDRYFEGDEFSIEEIRAAMRTEVMDGDIVPVAMGSNVQAQGVANLLSDIVRFFPSPDKRSCAGIHRTKSEIYEADYDFAKAKSAYVFKTMVDPFIGKYSFVKVCSGVLKGDDVLYNADAMRGLYVIPLADYNALEGTDISLAPDEVLTYFPDEEFDSGEIVLGKETYHVKENLKESNLQKKKEADVIKNVYVIMADDAAVEHVIQLYGPTKIPITMQYLLNFDMKGNDTAKSEALESMKARMETSGEVQSCYVEYREAYAQEFYGVYGGFFFLGIFVGFLFLMATVLIIYYKQISEGYDDKDRYQIMQKVGMSKKEVKGSIHSQILTVFFVPLLMAILHVTVAFKPITKLLLVFNLSDTHLSMMCTIGVSAVFAVFYVIVFAITSREYYKIVK